MMHRANKLHSENKALDEAVIKRKIRYCLKMMLSDEYVIIDVRLLTYVSALN